MAPVIDALMRRNRGRLLAALIGEVGDFDLAEDALSDAVESALAHWGRGGVPDRPEGWLLTAARRKVIDRWRREKRFAERAGDLVLLAEADEAARSEPPAEIPDDRLRLIFTCCHPSLDPKTRVALTLRTLGGLTTGEIAKAFLDKDAAMGQRLSRAKTKIRDAAIPYQVPGPEHWSERLASVLAVIYLIFNEGYVASDDGDALFRPALCDEAIHLARMLNVLRPGDAEIMGLLALLLLTHARRFARATGDGVMVPLSEQDRTRWDHEMLKEGAAVLDTALDLRLPGPFQIKAAIAELHTGAASHKDTDWAQIVLLYDALLKMEPTPVIRLNRAAALAEAGAREAALKAVEALKDDLQGYQPYHATRADLLARTGEFEMSVAAYDDAIALSRNRAERAFLARRQEELKRWKKIGRD